MRSATLALATFILSLVVGLPSMWGNDASPKIASDEGYEWSAPVNGLQARLDLIEKPKLHGVRWLVPYLELRNVRDLANRMEVPCDSKHLKFELVVAEGEVVRDGWSLPRSGPHADPGTIVLPHDSSIRISMECRNWGIPGGSAAMIATDSGAWVISEAERGKVYLRATLSADKIPLDDEAWHGSLQTPLRKIDWE